MLPPLRSHRQYVEFVERHLAEIQVIPFHHKTVYPVMKALDLTPLRSLVTSDYNLTRGRPAIPPEDMFRSFVLMEACQVASIDKWVATLRSIPYYAILSGFDPRDVPAVGTFFDFEARIVGLKPQNHLRNPRTKKQDTETQTKDKNADTPKHQGIIQKLADHIRKHPHHLALTDLERRINAILKACAVDHSARMGMIDWEHLYIAGDGTKIETWANPHGHKRCTCKEKCSCPRWFKDPQAHWGYDAYRERFVYGHTLYELTTYSLDHTTQLPLFLAFADGRRHDSVTGLLALHKAIDFMNYPIQTASFDKAHDAMGYYRLQTNLHLSLVIPLNERNQGHFSYPAPLLLNPDGHPLCPAQRPFRPWGFCPDRARIKWRCPTLSRATPQPCPLPQPCSPSPYGRTVYTYPESNPRLCTPIPRNTPLWTKHKNARTCAERSIKRKKEDFVLNRMRTGSIYRWAFRSLVAAINQHAAAWASRLPDEARERPPPKPLPL